MTKIFLGKVAFTDAGAYASGTSYDRFDFITTDDSCYLSVKDENKGRCLDRYGLVEMHSPWYASHGGGKDRPAGSK